ncbi:MAG: HigA family addiction module antidote protein [Candidatus Atribacteria bacterium]|nr:HigA family addiction module antidote protein [Candidatus Atribacteria bacterium]
MLPKLDKIMGIHPGYILNRELKSRGIKSSELASSINEHKQTISAILNKKRKITPSLSIKLSKKFNVAQDYFMLLQASYDVNTFATKSSARKKPNLAEFRQVLFWDTNINQIDWEKQQRAIIKRVLERGNSQEITELINFYGRQVISAEIKIIGNSRLPSFKKSISDYNL